MRPSLLESHLSADVLNFVILSHLDLPSAVALSATNSSLRACTANRIAELRAMLPPPYKPEALDAAIAAGDAEAATPLLREAMRRLGRNLDTLSTRLLERGYPVAMHCAVSGRRYLAPIEDIDERAAAINERGLSVPLVLVELWRALGGFSLAVRAGLGRGPCPPTPSTRPVEIRPPRAPLTRPRVRCVRLPPAAWRRMRGLLAILTSL